MSMSSKFQVSSIHYHAEHTLYVFGVFFAKPMDKNHIKQFIIKDWTLRKRPLQLTDFLSATIHKNKTKFVHVYMIHGYQSQGEVV